MVDVVLGNVLGPIEIPVLPVAVWRKNKYGGGKCIFIL